MKKTILILSLIIFMLPLTSYSETANPAAPHEEELIDLNSTNSRLVEIERRLTDLERELRYQRDYARSLEREITDLKRRSS